MIKEESCHFPSAMPLNVEVKNDGLEACKFAADRTAGGRLWGPANELHVLTGFWSAGFHTRDYIIPKELQRMWSPRIPLTFP